NSNVTKITETKKNPDSSVFADMTETVYDDFDRPDYSTQRGMMTDYDYDANGNRTLVSTPSGSTSYTYDKRNRLKTAGADENKRRRKQGPDDPPDKKATASYTYTPDGKPDTVTYISGASIKYNYNDQNRTEDIIHRSGTGEVLSGYEYTYDKNGNRKTLTETQNGITEKTEYNYDAADRLKDYTVKDSESIITAKYTYEGYNRKSEDVSIIFFGPTEENIEDLKNEGVPEEVTGKLAGLAGFGFATEDHFLNALKLAIGEADTAFYSPVILRAAQSEKPLRARDYEYENDSDRMRTVTHTDWTETVDDTDPDNPVTVRTPVTKTLSYTYDDNGSTVTKTDSLNPSDSLTFDYDARNRTVRIMKNGTEAGLYDYNAYGMKVRHYSGGRGDVDYYYDGTSVIEERKTDGNLLAHYRYADRLFRLDTQTDSQYYHHDALGSTVNLTDSDGIPEVSYRLDPWGKIRAQTGTTVNRQIFTGQEYDENTGLTDFGARLYDPDIARFVSQDAYLGEPGVPPSVHRYTYAYSNPLFYTDPTGNYTEEGVFNAFFKRYSDNEKAMEALFTVFGVWGFHLEQADFRFDDFDMPDFEAGTVPIARHTWITAERTDANAADQLYEVLYEFFPEFGLPRSGYRAAWDIPVGLGKTAVGGVGVFSFGAAAAGDPEPFTKAGFAGAAIASGSWAVEGWNQMWGFGPVNPIQEGAGWYGRSVAGPEGEMWARRMTALSQFSLGMVGGMGGTNIGTAKFNFKNFKSWGGTAKGALKADYTAAAQALKSIYKKWIASYKRAPKYKTTPMDNEFAGEHYYGNEIWPESRVEYLDDVARQAYKVKIIDGKFYDLTGKLFDTSVARPSVFTGEGMAIYAMDDMGNIYVSNYHVSGKFHHSSFLSGRPVAAAGQISVENGIIKTITRKSGHYRPKKEFFEQFIKELGERGVNLNNMKIIRGMRR
ncbi:MAG: hypothetical protein GY795_12305, partial [Desulfobacterales bacterium]|nr:hypothetical protein [Desulfobacterales bacterium]